MMQLALELEWKLSYWL